MRCGLPFCGIRSAPAKIIIMEWIWHASTHTHTQGLLYHLHFYASFIVLALLGLTHDRNFSIMVGLSPHCLGRERERERERERDR